MAAPHHCLYLSRADVEAVGLPMQAVIEAVELAFREKAERRAIMPEGPRTAEAAWMEEGATLITLDYDCYWKPNELSRVDQFFTDDLAQLELSWLSATLPRLRSGVRDSFPAPDSHRGRAS